MQNGKLFKVTSQINVLLAWSSSLEGRPYLDEVFVGAIQFLLQFDALLLPFSLPQVMELF